MLKAKERDFFISDWLRNRNTVECPGIWEKIYDQDFNYGEFTRINIDHYRPKPVKIACTSIINPYFLDRICLVDYISNDWKCK